ncbi:MAG: hypothetical protein DRN83_03775 [Hadesarchaea archaeon]|nr:MAG: hypothetical protein DRN83_03775 [Hadesarchaea archaeon]
MAILMGLLVSGTVIAASYFLLDHLYGEGHIITSTIIIENGGQQVTIDNEPYEVSNSELVENADGSSFYKLGIADRGSAFEEYNWGGSTPPAGGTAATINVPREAYEAAQTTGEPVTVSSTTETKPIDVLPIATGLGIVAGIASVALWTASRPTWGGVAATLIEHGLHDMTVRDVEIVGYMMELKEFTIPELMKLTKASKITVWRTVQKLVEKGLVRQTEKTKLAANGIGGRGKPSHVYMYVGRER